VAARLWALMRPARGRIAGMLACTAVGAAAAVVPPVLAGRFIAALAGHGHHAVLYGGLIAGATVLSSLAYAISDAAHAAVGAGLFARLRTQMLHGALRLVRRGARPGPGIVSRFVSDAELLESATVGALDAATLASFELAFALAALGILDLPALGATAVLVAASAVGVRLAQRPLPQAGEARQEALEEMAAGVQRTLATLAHAAEASRAIDRARGADVRLGVLEAANRHFSGALSGLVPIGVTVVAGVSGHPSLPTLLAVLLVSERALQAADDVADIAVDVHSVRGAIARCFALTDAS
jgi:ABC-type multidrug transport system fused ATPase/permease subunit